MIKQVLLWANWGLNVLGSPESQYRAMNLRIISPRGEKDGGVYLQIQPISSFSQWLKAASGDVNFMALQLAMCISRVAFNGRRNFSNEKK